MNWRTRWMMSAALASACSVSMAQQEVSSLPSARLNVSSPIQLAQATQPRDIGPAVDTSRDIGPAVDTSRDVGPAVDTSAAEPANTARPPASGSPTPRASAPTSGNAPRPAPTSSAPGQPAATSGTRSLQPAAPTSSSGAPPAPASATGRTPSGQPASAATRADAAPRQGRAMDRIELDAARVTGNRELPKVLYIVPWKRSDLGDLVGKPVNSLVDEVLSPIDRDVFKRENRYYSALASEGDAAGGTPAGEPARVEK